MKAGARAVVCGFERSHLTHDGSSSGSNLGSRPARGGQAKGGTQHCPITNSRGTGESGDAIDLASSSDENDLPGRKDELVDVNDEEVLIAEEREQDKRQRMVTGGRATEDAKGPGPGPREIGGVIEPPQWGLGVDEEDEEEDGAGPESDSDGDFLPAKRAKMAT